MNEDDAGPQFMVEEYNHATSEVTMHAEFYDVRTAIDSYLTLLDTHGMAGERQRPVVEGDVMYGGSHRTIVGNYGLSINTITN